MGSYHVMIDIETLGVNSNAPVLSIGIVDVEGNVFDRCLDVQSQIANGAMVDWSTVFWWMNQSDEARGSLKEFGDDPVITIEDMHKAFNWKDATVWCNGASFDFPILESLCKRVGCTVPWKFYQTRDFRTVSKLYDTINRHRPTVAHNALSDAEAQMATLLEILNEHKARNLIQEQYRAEAAAKV